jgi:hypothetical protein
MDFLSIYFRKLSISSHELHKLFDLYEKAIFRKNINIHQEIYLSVCKYMNKYIWDEDEYEEDEHYKAEIININYYLSQSKYSYEIQQYKKGCKMFIKACNCFFKIVKIDF